MFSNIANVKFVHILSIDFDIELYYNFQALLYNGSSNPFIK